MALADLEEALQHSTEVRLTTTGRTSGREISHPVWFVRQGESLYLLPVRGSDSDWYKNVLKTPTVRLAAGRAEYRARATPVVDPVKVSEVVDDFRAKYGPADVQAYFPKPDVAVEIPPA
jgi:deazaflavin-dependent oxidoreductase (nitroreductase family)